MNGTRTVEKDLHRIAVSGPKILIEKISKTLSLVMRAATTNGKYYYVMYEFDTRDDREEDFAKEVNKISEIVNPIAKIGFAESTTKLHLNILKIFPNKDPKMIYEKIVVTHYKDSSSSTMRRISSARLIVPVCPAEDETYLRLLYDPIT